MKTILSPIVFLALVLFSAYFDISNAAPLEAEDTEERLMRQLVSYAANDAAGSPDQEKEIAQKRYSQAQYTAMRGSSLDRNAVRRLLSMLVGKRSAIHKRSSVGAAAELPAFDDVNGFVILAGKITNDIISDAVQDEGMEMETGAGRE